MNKTVTTVTTIYYSEENYTETVTTTTETVWYPEENQHETIVTVSVN